MGVFAEFFAGCGGLSLGLQKADWKLSFAVEAHPDAFATYRANIIDRPSAQVEWPKELACEAHDIANFLDKYRDYLTAAKGSLDLLSGGPPCQGFSTNGRRCPDDPRNKLVATYLDIIQLLEPTIVLLENVRGFISMPHSTGSTYSAHVGTRLKELGYDIWSDLLFASDWGVPQRRPRFFLIAVRKGLLVGVDPFERLKTLRHSFLLSRQLPTDKAVSARDALDDLGTADKLLIPDPEFGHQGFQCIDYDSAAALSNYSKRMRDGFTGIPSDIRLPRHSQEVTDRFLKILQTCPKGRSISLEDRARLGLKKRSTTPMSPDLPSPTVTTLPDDIIHYEEPRILTVRENARLQSFPDWFSFKGPYTTGGDQRRHSCPRYTQVGNAVPPLLAEAIGEMLKGLFDPLASHETLELGDVMEMGDHVAA